MIKFEFGGYSWDTETRNNLKMKFDDFNMTPFEIFIRWVRFMNILGYNLDPVKMEEMWKGEMDEKED